MLPAFARQWRVSILLTLVACVVITFAWVRIDRYRLEPQQHATWLRGSPAAAIALPPAPPQPSLSALSEEAAAAANAALFAAALADGPLGAAAQRVGPRRDFLASGAGRAPLTVALLTTDPVPLAVLHTRDTAFEAWHMAMEPREAAVRWLLRWLFERDGDADDAGDAGDAALFVDVGANEGFYSLLAAAYGARVVAVEPQPDCVLNLAFAFTANALRRQPTLLRAVVGPADTPPLHAERTGSCSGTAQFHDQRSGGGAGLVAAVPLDAIVAANGGAARVVHVDAEGAELLVLRSGLEAIEAKRVANLVFEFNPSRWAAYGVGRDDGCALARRLEAAGMVCHDLRDATNGPIWFMRREEVRDFGTLPPVSLCEVATELASSGGETDVWCRAVD